MEQTAIELKWIDKSAWGEGAWVDEPDKAQWVDQVTGLTCLIVRHPHLGSLCGYVGVKAGHPAFERPKSELFLSVHGGVSYAAFCDEDEPFGALGICHSPAPGDTDRVWWIGFDCGHAGDLHPAMLVEGSRIRTLMEEMGWVYRDYAFVREQCAKLARGLAEMTIGSKFHQPIPAAVETMTRGMFQGA